MFKSLNFKLITRKPRIHLQGFATHIKQDYAATHETNHTVSIPQLVENLMLMIDCILVLELAASPQFL